MGTIGADLAGKTCVVTGAARSIGLAIAEAYRAAGARVAMIDLNPEVAAQAERLAAQVGEPSSDHNHVRQAVDLRQLAISVQHDVSATLVFGPKSNRPELAHGAFDELRLALSHAGVPTPPITHVRRYGGILPQQSEILARIEETQGAFV